MAPSSTPTEAAPSSRVILVSATLRLSMDQFGVAVFSDDSSTLYLRNVHDTWFQYSIDDEKLTSDDRTFDKLDWSEELWGRLGAVASWELAKQYSVDMMTSPDGQYLAYVRDEAGKAMLSVYSEIDQGITDLGTAPEGVCSVFGNIVVAWGRNKSKFAFQCGATTRIYLGDMEQRAWSSTDAIPTDLYPDWALTSDGEQVAFTANEDSWHLSVVTLRSNVIRRIAPLSLAPAWSENGHRLYYVRSTVNPIALDSCSLNTYDLETESEVQLLPQVHENAIIGSPIVYCAGPIAVSPDERFISFQGKGGYYILDRGAFRK